MINKMCKVAKQCGEMMRSAYSGTIRSEMKSGFRDLVTEYDTRVQNFAVEALRGYYPEAHFICEEGDGGNPSAEGYTFIIDPIDGTANFTHHYGHSCTSISCTQNGMPVAAAIYDPFLDELFTAERGKGAFMNGQPVHVYDGPLEGALVIFGTAPYNMELQSETLKRVQAIYGKCQDIRRTGSAALDLCYAAMGRAGLYFEMELALWDYAAGALIVEEAGGICMTINGEPLHYDRPVKTSIMAGSERTIREAREFI